MTLEPTIPTNDDEVIALLEQDKDSAVSANLVAIFKLKRSAGVPLIEAYQQTLIAHLEAAGYQFDPHGKLVSAPA
jgi:hypothetical protein